jgi:hypothetical protein
MLKRKPKYVPKPHMLSPPLRAGAARSSAAADFPAYVRSDHRTGFSAEAQRRAQRHALKLPFRVRDGESKFAATKRWLRKLLSGGEVYAGDVLDIAYAVGISFRLLEKAKVSLGVRFMPGNGSKYACWRLWFWCLPDADDDGDEEEDE